MVHIATIDRMFEISDNSLYNLRSDCNYCSEDEFYRNLLCGLIFQIAEHQTDYPENSGEI